MMAGLMAATVMGGIAPIHAQTMDHGRGDRARADVRSSGHRGPDANSHNGVNRNNAMQRQAVRQGPQRDRQHGWQHDRQRATPRPQAAPAPGRADGQWRTHRPTTDPAARRPDFPRQNNVRPGTPHGARDAADRPNVRPMRPDPRQDWRGGDRRDHRQTPPRTWRQDHRDDRRDHRWDGRRDAQRPGHWTDGRRYDDRTRWTNQQRWNNGWRQDRRYDWQSHRSRYGDRFRMGRYAAPRGWDYGYRRFSTGIVLSGLLYSRSYWVSDPYAFRLPPAYGTLRWVRYYDDALLVDIRDGYVVDVIHDFFW